MQVTIVATATCRTGSSFGKGRTNTRFGGRSTPIASHGQSCHLRSANLVSCTLASLSLKPFQRTISNQPVPLSRLLRTLIIKRLKEKKDGLAIRQLPRLSTSVLRLGRLRRLLQKGGGIRSSSIGLERNLSMRSLSNR